MRNPNSWKEKLRKTLGEQWVEESESLNPAQICDIELGLALLLKVSPKSPAGSLWSLLVGYPFPAAEVSDWSQREHQALGIARHLIPYYRNHYQWLQALDAYKGLPEIVRGYQLDDDGHITQRPVTIASERFQVYDRTLEQTVPHRKEPVRWAQAGSYNFASRRFFCTVKIDEDLVQPPPVGHEINKIRVKRPLDIAWSELLSTSSWMDQQLQAKSLKPQNFQDRMDGVRLELVSVDRKTLSLTNHLTIQGLMHVIGMVSSGKSTLMDVLCVWAARQGLHVTMVVGDVISALNRVQLLTTLGISAAPILGASNRARHLNRLHHIVHASQPVAPFEQSHTGFRSLSTACLLDGLRDDPQPLEIGSEPCINLSANTEGDEIQTRYACPLYSPCPIHNAQRDLVQASVWIATPASLIYTRVAAQLNSERLRFLELVYRRSDLVIVDEADQVQVQLDTMFSPSQTLMGQSSEAWLSQIQQVVTSQLNLEGRGQLRQEEVDAWCQAHDVAQTATSRIYGLLLRSLPLRRWIERDDYFTDLTLFEALSKELEGSSRELGSSSLEQIEKWLLDFREYIDDPLGERKPGVLSSLTHQVLAVTSEERRLAALLEWMRSHGFSGPSDETAVFLAHKLELALLVSVLQDRLSFILRRWRQVEAILRLEKGGALLFQRPPDDYTAVIPAAPMGNVLAFQYLRGNDRLPDSPGELRFFRCMGVGRWLLLKLPTLFEADGIAGPNTLLLSGTSWAGTSPVFHLQVPVNGVLRAPDKEVTAVHQSQFTYKPMLDERTGRPIRISGQEGSDRVNALRAMAFELARPSRARGASLLEQERERLDPTRRRLLLLVGSYDEARTVYRYLVDELRPDWKGQATYLVPDDSLFESEWRKETGAQETLQRGLVHQFADTESWILIAPLLAVERGHNILNENQQAALGAVYFMVRPHPRPNDLYFAIHSINQWAIAHHADTPWLQSVATDMSWGALGEAFRQQGFKRWRQLIRLPMIYSILEAADRDAVTWGQLVTIWQVIGRLVRGGSPARVIFCDSAFVPGPVEDSVGLSKTPSLLTEMRRILHPYFNQPDLADSALVQALYGPLYKALSEMQGVPNNA